jgi:hypothetical protein
MADTGVRPSKLVVSYWRARRTHRGHCSDPCSKISSHRSVETVLDVPSDIDDDDLSAINDGRDPRFVTDWLDGLYGGDPVGSGYCGGACTSEYRIRHLRPVYGDRPSRLVVSYWRARRTHRGYCSDPYSEVSSHRSVETVLDVPSDIDDDDLSAINDGRDPRFVTDWLDGLYGGDPVGSGYCGGACTSEYRIRHLRPVYDEE